MHSYSKNLMSMKFSLRTIVVFLSLFLMSSCNHSKEIQIIQNEIDNANGQIQNYQNEINNASTQIQLQNSSLIDAKANLAVAQDGANQAREMHFFRSDEQRAIDIRAAETIKESWAQKCISIQNQTNRLNNKISNLQTQIAQTNTKKSHLQSELNKLSN